MIGSSFFKCVKQDYHAVSVYIQTPPWFAGKTATELCVSKKLHKAYYKEKSISSDDYIQEYFNMLNKLDAEEILKKYDSKIFTGWYSIDNKEFIDNRHIIAEWINFETGIEIKELKTSDEIIEFNVRNSFAKIGK